MPDQHTPAERRAMKRLTQTVNSTPEFWRVPDGTLMARTRGNSGAAWLYRFNPSEGRWNDAGREA